MSRLVASRSRGSTASTSARWSAASISIPISSYAVAASECPSTERGSVRSTRPRIPIASLARPDLSRTCASASCASRRSGARPQAARTVCSASTIFPAASSAMLAPSTRSISCGASCTARSTACVPSVISPSSRALMPNANQPCASAGERLTTSKSLLSAPFITGRVDSNVAADPNTIVNARGLAYLLRRYHCAWCVRCVRRRQRTTPPFAGYSLRLPSLPLPRQAFAQAQARSLVARVVGYLLASAVKARVGRVERASGACPATLSHWDSRLWRPHHGVFAIALPRFDPYGRLPALTDVLAHRR